MIILEGLSVSFKKSESLFNNINLAVRRGETFVLLGASGTGKSTLLKIISGLMSPTSGRVTVNTSKLGMLFQKNALFDSLSIFENLAFPLREQSDLSEVEITSQVRLYLNAVGLEHAEKLFPDEISGGMQKRVGIARALILKPEVILYDDPTAGLDPITSRMIAELIIKLKSEHQSTSIVVTNDMSRAFQMADRLGILMEGLLHVTGTIEETKKNPNAQVQRFIRGEADEKYVS
jgi:phospholipid/cholesterol/gamma-HCH transport system ATP-binding protein